LPDPLGAEKEVEGTLPVHVFVAGETTYVHQDRSGETLGLPGNDEIGQDNARERIGRAEKVMKEENTRGDQDWRPRTEKQRRQVEEELRKLGVSNGPPGYKEVMGFQKRGTIKMSWPVAPGAVLEGTWLMPEFGSEPLMVPPDRTEEMEPTVDSSRGRPAGEYDEERVLWQGREIGIDDMNGMTYQGRPLWHQESSQQRDGGLFPPSSGSDDDSEESIWDGQWMIGEDQGRLSRRVRGSRLQSHGPMGVTRLNMLWRKADYIEKVLAGVIAAGERDEIQFRQVGDHLDNLEGRIQQCEVEGLRSGSGRGTGCQFESRRGRGGVDPSRQERNCWACGGIGHTRAQCIHRTAPPNSDGELTWRIEMDDQDREGIWMSGCYTCQEEGRTGGICRHNGNSRNGPVEWRGICFTCNPFGTRKLGCQHNEAERSGRATWDRFDFRDGPAGLQKTARWLRGEHERRGFQASRQGRVRFDQGEIYPHRNDRPRGRGQAGRRGPISRQ